MAEFRADLHIHTVLSPCGELEMSPSNIIRIAKEKGLDIIGITDHNSTRQAKMVRDLGREHGIYVLTGAEVTTAEEAHCLAFLPDDEKLDEFQAYLDAHLPFIRNNPEKFGYQVVVNADEEIIYEEERLLIPAINQSIEEVEKKVHSLNGIFIPAHIDKKVYSIISQLGFIPPTLRYDALELSRHTTVADFIAANPYLKNATFIQSSDAHFPDEIGSVFTIFDIPSISFENIQRGKILI